MFPSMCHRTVTHCRKESDVNTFEVHEKNHDLCKNPDYELFNKSENYGSRIFKRWQSTIFFAVLSAGGEEVQYVGVVVGGLVVGSMAAVVVHDQRCIELLRQIARRFA